MVVLPPVTVGSVVQSIKGRDRFRVFIVVDEDMSREYPTVSVVNGVLHKIAKPKIKHRSHVRLIGQLTQNEMEAFRLDFSDKKAAELVLKYDQNREFTGLMHK